MPLYIRDDAVDALAEEARRLTHAKTKTEAVRRALEAQIAVAKARPPQKSMEEREKHFREGLAALQDRVAAMGPNDPDFDMKTFMDELWESD